MIFATLTPGRRATRASTRRKSRRNTSRHDPL